MNELTPIAPDALAKLRQKAQLAVAIQVWKPERGDVLEGAIIGARDADGPFGPQRQLLVKNPTGAIIAVWLSAWLTGQLQNQSAEMGDLVSIVFHGKETGSRGQLFNRMTVVILKPDGE